MIICLKTIWIGDMSNDMWCNCSVIVLVQKNITYTSLTRKWMFPFQVVFLGWWLSLVHCHAHSLYPDVLRQAQISIMHTSKSYDKMSDAEAKVRGATAKVPPAEFPPPGYRPTPVNQLLVVSKLSSDSGFWCNLQF